jgi:hypothetical protein
MKTAIQVIIILFLSPSVFSQNADTIKHYEAICLKDYYNQTGIIFKDSYDPHIDIPDMKERYTPTLDDVKNAEIIFQRDYGKLTNQNTEIKTYYANFVRQYIGYLDTVGNKIIKIYLTDNSNKRKTKRILGKNWELKYHVDLSEKFTYAWDVVNINLTSESIK